MPEPTKTEPIELKDDDALGGDSLNDLLNPPSLVEESTSADGKSKEGDRSSGFTAEDVKKLISEAREKDEERFGELEQTVTYFKGRLAEREETRREEPKKEDEIGEFTYDETKLAEGMAENAPRTLAQLVKDLGAHVEKKLRKELSQDVNGRLTQDSRQRALSAAYQSDVTGVEKEFAEFVTDKKFLEECDQELATTLRKRNPSAKSIEALMAHYLPDDLSSTASRVALRWTKVGKAKTSTENGGVGSGGGGETSLREIVRRVPLSDSIGNGNGRATSGTPKTIDQLFSDEKDRKIAKKVIVKQGVSEEAYVRQYLRAKEEDQDFDRAH